MIQKILDRHFDSISFIHYNKNKIAEDNIRNTADTVMFLSGVSTFLLFLIVLLSGSYYFCFFLIAILFVLVGIHLVQKVFLSNISESFKLSRMYSFFFYGVMILAYSYADIIMNMTSRCVVFPCAIIVITAIYMDTFLATTVYKIVLTIIYCIMDSMIRPHYGVKRDLFVAGVAIIASLFSYFEIVDLAINKGEDRRILERKSTTDLLTGIYNKLSFEEKCNEYLKKRKPGARCILFIFDLDNFKEVNDTFGHQTGDNVLKKFSEILQSYFHPYDIMGRIGGDEFMVLVMGEMPEGFAEKRCRSILHEFKTARINQVSGLTCSIGIVSDNDCASFTELYKKADEALYIAKESGKATFNLHEEDEKRNSRTS